MADAPAPIGHNRPAARTFKRVCPECGEPFRATNEARSFCCDEHKRAFNNRRMLRGAVIYDLFMSLRFDRSVAKTLGVWSTLCEIARAYREEDNLRRAGRQSWRDPRDVRGERPWLNAVILHRNINPKKPGGYQ